MSLLAPTLQAFFTDRLTAQKRASAHTIAAYRDTIRLLLAFAAQHAGKAPSDLDIDDLQAPLIGTFLDHLEHERVLRLSSCPRSAISSRHLFGRGRISVSGQTGARRSMSGPQDASRRNGRRKRVLSAQEKYQIWQQLLSGELTQRQAAEQWNVDPTTIMRIRRVGREGALSALAQSRPGVRAGASGAQDAELAAARAEIARLEETVKEQAIELVALRGKTRSGW